MSETENTETQAVTSFVEYQSGAVVSKVALRASGGNVTLFAFDKEQGLSEHTAPYDVIVQIIDGTAEITISGKVYTVRTGEMITLPANQPHALHAKEKFKMMLIMLKNNTPK